MPHPKPKVWCGELAGDFFLPEKLKEGGRFWKKACAHAADRSRRREAGFGLLSSQKKGLERGFKLEKRSKVGGKSLQKEPQKTSMNLLLSCVWGKQLN